VSLRGFVTASALLHLGALAALEYPALEAGTASPASRLALIITRSQVAPDSTTSASLASASQPLSPAAAPVTTPDPGPVRQMPHRITSARAMAAPPAPATPAVRRIPAARQIIAKNRARAPGGGKPEAADAVQAAAKTDEASAELRKMFSANFTYPPLARRRGWEGEVRLGLRLEPDGRVTHIHIVKSSGFAILDKSALKTARGLELAPAAARWLRGEWFDMILPVRYQLNDG
jgi:protein TonB